MPTIIYAVHGIGAGTADGAARPAGSEWYAPVVTAMEYVFNEFGVKKPSVVMPDATAAPAGSADPNAVWICPISYHKVFDEYRASANARDNLVATINGLNAALVDAELTELKDNEFLWTNCLDVLLWWGDKVQTRDRATTIIDQSITKIDKLARAIPGANVRRVLVSHSLGTAASTAALRHAAGNDPWRNSGGIRTWFTLANVAPFVLGQPDVYSTSLVPGAANSIIASTMYNVRHELDPVPWLIPPRAFDPQRAGATEVQWKAAQTNQNFSLLNTARVVAPPNGTPGIGDVHGFANYVLSPEVAFRLASIAGAAGVLDQAGYTTKWRTLPALQCTNPQALALLQTGMTQFAGAMGTPSSDWVRRLLGALQLILAAMKKC